MTKIQSLTHPLPSSWLTLLDVRRRMKAYVDKEIPMSTPVTATELRKNLYQLLEGVLQTGEPQEVNLKGRKLWIVPAETRRRNLDELPRREGLRCSPDELVETTWEGAWTPDV